MCLSRIHRLAPLITSRCGVTVAIRFMSNLYLAVEKVTESLLGNIKVKVSLGLAANDKRREGVARCVGPLLTYLPKSNRN